jgi:hypothetical protein
MRITAAVIALACAAATTATAGPGRLSDTEYLQAARCSGLAASQAMDTSAYDAILKAQRVGRDGYIQDKADATRSDAKRQAARAGSERKPMLLAELDGACRRFGG